MITKQPLLNTIWLDISDINVINVTDGQSADFDFSIIKDINPRVGHRLEIKIPTVVLANSNVVLQIHYITSTKASAVTWLTPEQTAGKKLPYVYTQCQTIHWRSIAPLQDTSSIKATYSIYVISPKEIIVRASGNITDEYVHQHKRHTKFSMSIPVQSYLMAIAGGNLVERRIVDRTYVITEPELIDKAERTLADLEKALEIAEEYLTPYIWGVYKVLFLPPSFPYGGMENPLLTFATSVMIIEDKSAFEIFVHELSHSWFGNLVTNKNMSDFWLNEGFTVFLERKIDSVLYGKEHR